jgi:hypothetical protein
MSYYNPSAEEKEARKKSLQVFDGWNQQALLSVFSLLGLPQTYLDIGCGSGAMSNLARRCGIDTVGVDLIAEPPNITHDLREPLNLGRTFQLVTCIEVAEHLPLESAPVLANSIARHMKADDVLIFTAALPGQQGDNHVNLISPFEWRGILYKAGLNYDKQLGIHLSLLWTQTTGSLMHLPANLQVFRRMA